MMKRKKMGKYVGNDDNQDDDDDFHSKFLI